jgi:hypothetical protein
MVFRSPSRLPFRYTAEPALQEALPAGTALPEEPETHPFRSVFERERYNAFYSELQTPPDQLRRVMEQSLNRALPLFFKGDEGSSTDIGELFQRGDPGTPELRSQWMLPYLFPGRNLPSLRLRVTYDPVTGEPRISGGFLASPRGSFEAGYEAEAGSEEYRATLQWKKSF